MKLMIQTINASLRGKERVAAYKAAEQDLLSKALTESGLLMTSCCDVPVLSRGEHGKPFFPDLADFHFNISNSGSYVVLGLAEPSLGEGEIGIDLQCQDPPARDLTSIARRFFRPEEAEEIASLTDPVKRSRLFYRLWTIKEAYIKYTGEGLSRSLDSFRIDFGKRQILDPSTEEVLANFRELTPPEEGYYLSCVF